MPISLSCKILDHVPSVLVYNDPAWPDKDYITNYPRLLSKGMFC